LIIGINNPGCSLAQSLAAATKTSNMQKIKFTQGTIQKLTAEYYTLQLFNQAGATVYSATVDSLTAAGYIDKYNNIKLIK